MVLLFRLAALAALLMPGSALARELVYRVDDGCPALADVQAALDERSPAGAHVQLEAHTTPTGFEGILIVGSAPARTLHARTCQAVVDALLVVASLTETESPAPVVVAPVHTPLPPIQPPPAPYRPEFGWVAGVAVSSTSLTRAELLLGGRVFLELQRLRGWRPSLRAGLGWATTTPWTPMGGLEPTFTTLAGELDVCAWPAVHGRLEFGGCVHGQVGALTAGAVDRPELTRTRAWALVGPTARGRYVFDTHSVTKPMVELAAGALATLVRDSFHYPAHDVLQPAPVLWSVMLAVGVVLR